MTIFGNFTVKLFHDQIIFQMCYNNAIDIFALQRIKNLREFSEYRDADRVSIKIFMNNNTTTVYRMYDWTLHVLFSL